MAPSPPSLTLTVGSEAQLTGASASLVAAIKEQLTLDNPEYRDAQKYGRWIGKRLKPQLHFYWLDGDAIRFPRGFARQAVFLCRRFMHQNPEVVDQRHELPPLALTFTQELRPYQQKALADILRHEFGVLEAGTGSGKTVVALAAIAARRQPTLVLVHTKELLHQWAERVESFLGVTPGLIGDGHYEIRPVTIAIVNSARNHLTELPAHFGHLCVDECHRVPASLFTEVVTAFACRYMLGLSATAFRRDGLTKLIYMYLGDRVHQVDTHHLHATGAVLKPEFIQRPTEFRYVYRGNYQALMKALTNNKTRNDLIVSDIVKEAVTCEGTILVVSDRVQHCEELAGLLAKQGLSAPVLTGQTRPDERAELVAAIQQGRVKILISTVQLIGEGFDCPNLTTLFLTTPIKFTGRLLQVVGRVLRPAAGKTPRVYDYVDPVKALAASAQSRWLTFQFE